MPHRFKGERTLMRIFIGESDKYQGKPLYEALLERLRHKGLAGATVLRGVAGFGASSVVHTDKVLRLSLDLPLIIEVVETEESIKSDRIDWMDSSVSTTSMMSGRSSESRSTLSVWTTLDAPKPATPRSTVAPASPLCRRRSSNASYNGFP